MFRLDDKNIYLQKQYEENSNYFVETPENGDRCFIFFSGNGLYYPNDTQTFTEAVVEKNRYEWWSIGHSDEIIRQAGKIIYVRDIYKQYYVNGISKNITNIDDLCKLLEDMTKGMQIITCGNSAGGYLAIIVGNYLRAERIYSFGGQFTLRHILKMDKNKLNDSYFFIKQYETDMRKNKYYDISDILESSTSPIFYFYSALCEEDINQFEVLNNVKSKDNIYCFAMKSKYHGYLMFNSCYKKVLSIDMKGLLYLYKHYKGKIISLRSWSLCVLSQKEAVQEIANDIIQNHKSLQVLSRK